MLKLSENPPILSPAVGSLRELTGPWWVAHTRPRNEKAFAWDMIEQQLPCFLPLIKRTIFSGGRRRAGMLPLFPSYVFIAGGAESRLAALQTQRVVNVIPVPDQNELLRELYSIERVLASGANLDPSPFAIVGQRVQIVRGPFKGILGRVVRRDTVTRLVLEISILGKGAEMDIDADIVEAVE